MCPNCRAFVTITDRVCPYCEMSLGPRAIDMRGSDLAASFMPRANLTAIIILAINVSCYLLQLVLDPKVNEIGVLYAPLVLLRGQWWRLITAGFLHGGFVHLAMNSWSLFILVTEVEQFYGTNRLIVAYVVSTITGFLCALIFTPRSMVLGASCAAFGLMGAMVAMGIGKRADPQVQLVRQLYRQFLIQGLVLGFLMNYFGFPVSNSGHIGGLIGGFLVGWIAGRPTTPGSPRERFWQIAAFAAIFLVLLAFSRDFAYISQNLRLFRPGSM